jgi:cytoskeleton protein RodZ
VSETLDFPTAEQVSLHPGAILRQGRESHGLSVIEVAQALKLTPRQVSAIEGEQFDLLPGNTFARGFVRNYARFLQIDAGPLLAALERHLAQGEVDLNPPSNAGGTIPVGSATRGVPRVLLVSLVVVVGALALGVYFERFRPQGLSTWRPGASISAKEMDAAAPRDSQTSEKVELPTVPTAQGLAAPATQPTVVSVPAAAPEAQPVAVPGSVPAAVERGVRRLQFSFDKEAWVEVKDGAGKIIVSKLNKPGSTLTVEGRAPFSLVVGNAAFVQLKYDDRPVDLEPYKASSVARFSLE